MKTKIISICLLLFLIASPTKTQDWEFVGLDSLLIKQIYVSGDTIWAGSISRIDTNKISGLYRSTNDGLSWVRIDSSLGEGATIYSYVDLNSENIWLSKLIFNNFGIETLFNSTNRGVSWQLINQLEDIPIDWFAVSPFNKNEIYARESHYIIAGWYETVYRSTDGGINWQEITYLPASSHGRRLTFNLSLSDSNKLYAAVDDLLLDQYFYISSNKGNSWNYISEPPAVELELITDPTIPNRVFIFPGYHLTEDDGYSWQVASSGLQDVSSYLSFYYDPRDKATFYNLRKDGLYKSINNPIYWQLIEGSDNLPLNLGGQGYQYWDIGQLRNIFIDTLTNEIYVGTAKGIYKKNLVTEVEVNGDNHPYEFTLYQNYPNPFNPSTTISYNLSQRSSVTLKVFDVLGREIATLVNEEKAQGEYKTEFYGNSLTSGIYFYILTAITQNGERIKEGKKMLLIK